MSYGKMPGILAQALHGGRSWIPALLATLLPVAPLPAPAAAAVRETPSWLVQGEPTASAETLLAAFRDAARWGLDPSDYAAPLVIRTNDPEWSAAMSQTAKRFVSDLHYGRIDPRKVGFDLPSRVQDLDLDAAALQLSRAADARSVISSVEPRYRHYAYLKTQLERYRALATDPTLTSLPALRHRRLGEGDPYTGASALRRLLIELGDLSSDSSPTPADDMLDAATTEALRRFQFRHGLAQDGLLGQRTFAALTVPISRRVRQIELTLERWRWLPSSGGPTIIVNIPQYRLFAFRSADDDESRMLTMDVIVGQTYPHTRTPVFVGDLQYLIFQPYWDVPRSILTRELLPKIRTQPGYLVGNDLEIVGATHAAGPTQHATAAELDGLASGKLRVRQRPGPRNSLGAVKFMLPNRYNVYLHGTPAVELFGQSRRTFSHGCIRVSDPHALAAYTLDQAAEAWSDEQIRQAMQGTETKRVDLAHPIRVMIVYGTAVATEAGRIYFFDDVYGNDARLSAVLAARRN